MTIKQRRKELSISRRTMAKRFHITARQYKVIEENTDEMNAYLYMAVCEFLDIKPLAVKGVNNCLPILKRKRLVQGLSLRYAARKAGMNVFTYWIAERRCRSLDVATLQRIANVVAPEMKLLAVREAEVI